MRSKEKGTSPNSPRTPNPLAPEVLFNDSRD